MKALTGDSNASAPLLLATKISIPASSTGGAAEAALLGKGRYKVWALAAIALLALWSMSAASVSLRWSAGDLAAAVSGDLDAPLRDDLDSLEMEEREKLVGRMWDMYTCTSDEVCDTAISEIARMSAHRLELEQPVNANEEEGKVSIRNNDHGRVKQ
ncbi:uncharacterized protein LOC119355538 isoform X2 [Triticum dicoccoides]|uniref:uncharacterized protein LOC119355538 isoform X2 n=1 Tax=Triticum dicoccoides TaxID=85692 RepID=UPI00188E9FAF|nr:uncharacterized protein LOC119355538 isoform X2 [Triticum dicoccoides]